MAPNEIMMAAAHNDDLGAARKEGMLTAYINRPTEYGIEQKVDFEANSDWDIIADTVEAVADELDCPKI
jgi:2-haloacid dehalogenase